MFGWRGRRVEAHNGVCVNQCEAIGSERPATRGRHLRIEFGGFHLIRGSSGTASREGDHGYRVSIFQRAARHRGVLFLSVSSLGRLVRF